MAVLACGASFMQASQAYRSGGAQLRVQRPGVGLERAGEREFGHSVIPAQRSIQTSAVRGSMMQKGGLSGPRGKFRGVAKPKWPVITCVDVGPDLTVLFDQKRQRLIYVLLVDSSAEQGAAQAHTRVADLIKLTQATDVWVVADEQDEQDDAVQSAPELTRAISESCPSNVWEVQVGEDTFNPGQIARLQAGFEPSPSDGVTPWKDWCRDKPNRIGSRMRRDAEEDLTYMHCLRQRTKGTTGRGRLVNWRRYERVKSFAREFLQSHQLTALAPGLALVNNRHVESVWFKLTQYRMGSNMGHAGRKYGFLSPFSFGQPPPDLALSSAELVELLADDPLLGTADRTPSDEEKKQQVPEISSLDVTSHARDQHLFGQQEGTSISTSSFTVTMNEAGITVMIRHDTQKQAEAAANAESKSLQAAVESEGGVVLAVAVDIEAVVKAESGVAPGKAGAGDEATATEPGSSSSTSSTPCVHVMVTADSALSSSSSSSNTPSLHVTVTTDANLSSIMDDAGLGIKGLEQAVRDPSPEPQAPTAYSPSNSSNMRSSAPSPEPSPPPDSLSQPGTQGPDATVDSSEDLSSFLYNCQMQLSDHADDWTILIRMTPSQTQISPERQLLESCWKAVADDSIPLGFLAQPRNEPLPPQQSGDELRRPDHSEASPSTTTASAAAAAASTALTSSTAASSDAARQQGPAGGIQWQPPALIGHTPAAVDAIKLAQDLLGRGATPSEAQELTLALQQAASVFEAPEVQQAFQDAALEISSRRLSVQAGLHSHQLKPSSNSNNSTNSSNSNSVASLSSMDGAEHVQGRLHSPSDDKGAHPKNNSGQPESSAGAASVPPGPSGPRVSLQEYLAGMHAAMQAAFGIQPSRRSSSAGSSGTGANSVSAARNRASASQQQGQAEARLGGSRGRTNPLRLRATSMLKGVVGAWHNPPASSSDSNISGTGHSLRSLPHPSKPLPTKNTNVFEKQRIPREQASRVVTRLLQVTHKPAHNGDTYPGQDVIIVLPTALSRLFQPPVTADSIGQTLLVTDHGLIEVDSTGAPLRGPPQSEREILDSSVTFEDLLTQVAASWSSWEQELMAPNTKAVSVAGTHYLDEKAL